ncbi:MAG: gamma-glutamyl-gamma-aminobutyrate hydrolase family protein [Fimbriimonadaceae bacterium]|nr:gamma-glutamyl-gamma-aminobutyrate hydrolase family protein [Fimbriimonadaceae bacterium]QYK57604.1 MAG: gamma-glutamyl-gamma-aminobutyrate hydrolase family protein [Fimbriimonadaceae bacterium]
MTRPIVGIVAGLREDPAASEHRTLHCVGTQYVDALRRAGATALVIPQGSQPADVLPILDGWVIMGGPDIDPARYGQSAHPENTAEDTGRHETEAAVFRSAPHEMPILGICYGCQFVNVQRGGTLVQHLMDDPAKGEHRGDHVHLHRVEPGSRLASLTQTLEFEAVSSHHQAVATVGEGLRPVAWAPDGTIEALEDTTGRWIVTVQWHPERTPDSPATIHLLEGFVEACRRFSENKQACGTW